MRYRYLLFDADNTLFDFDRAEEAAFYAAFSACGLTPDARAYALYHQINHVMWQKLERGEISRERLKTLRYELLLQELNLPDAGKSQELSNMYFCQLSKQSVLYKGAEDVCRILSTYYKLYIVTNGMYETQTSRIRASAVHPYFSGIYISEKVGAAKPDRAFFDYVMQDIGCPDPSVYCVIGDSLTSDIEGANRAGMDAVWLCHGENSDTQGRIVRHILKDIRDLPDYLKRQEQKT